MMEHIINYITTNYLPTDNYESADIRITTAELVEILFSIYPQEIPVDELIAFLKDEGYIMYDLGNFSAEWIFIKNKK